MIAIVLLSIGAVAYAGMLPWGLTSTLQIRWEDERLDADPSVGKAKIYIRRPFEIGKLNITPNLYYEYQSYDGFLSHDRFKEADLGILFDIIAFNNEMVKITVSPGFEYQNNCAANDDSLMILQLKADL